MNDLPPDYEQRRKILEDLDETMLVEAAAGTGKTTCLVARMVALVREGRCNIENLAAITFTRKASAELRSKFQVELERAAREVGGEEGARLGDAIGHVDRCFIGTIHSFCARLLRERPIEAGVDLDFKEIEEEEDSVLREATWEEYVAGLYAGDDGTIERLEELGLEVEQLRGGFRCFSMYPDVEEWPAPDIDLGDLHEVRRSLRDYVEHMERLVPSFPAHRGGDAMMQAYERVARLARTRDLARTAELMEVLEDFARNPKVVQKYWPGGGEQAREEQRRWGSFKRDVASPALARWYVKRYAAVIPLFRGAAEVYERRRSASGRLNFKDLLIRASSLLRDHPQVRRYFQGRFTRLLVDEFQDTDPIQAEVMMYLTSEDPDEGDWRRCVPARGSLFVVGDPKQSIYRFRRADIVTYNRVKEIISRSGGSVVELSANFRSVPALLDWLNLVFDSAFPGEADDYSPAACTMLAGLVKKEGAGLSGVDRIDLPGDVSGKKADILSFEPSFIARTIRSWLDAGLRLPGTEEWGGREVEPGDFMIITRNKKNLAAYAGELGKLGIPHQVTGGHALRQVEELGLLARCLKAVVEPENPVALVAALRGGLFGLSDRELYAFKRAGGRFSYRSECPSGMDGNTSSRFEDAFSRLMRYDGWLRVLPPATAIERIAGDLGLQMSALVRPGGDVLAGSMEKMFELLRLESAGRACAADIVGYMARQVEEDREFDGIPVKPPERAGVRVLNLHKAKGLEAPIVFLADPTGKSRHDVEVYIDRSGERSRGFMAIRGERGRSRFMVASPLSWEDCESEERRFMEAEEKRLLYVAATRAACRLIISSRPNGGKKSYWDFFAPFLEGCRALEETGGPRIRREAERIRVAVGEVREAMEGIYGRLGGIAAPTYEKAATKEVSVTEEEMGPAVSGGEHGMEWGTVIHALLEAAMLDAGEGLEELARALVREEGLEPQAAERALRTVESVRESEVWRRAGAAGEVMVEVPFVMSRGSKSGDRRLPLILGGAVDLAFKEKGEWVIIDYKTDVVAGRGLDRLVEHYRGQVLAYAGAWREITGEPVKEAGLYFTRTGDYVVV